MVEVAELPFWTVPVDAIGQMAALSWKAYTLVFTDVQP